MSVFPPGIEPPALTGATIERADQVRVDPDALAGMMTMRARLLKMADLDPDISPENELLWGSLAEASDDSDLAFLGLDKEVPCFVEIKRTVRGSTLPGNPALRRALMALPPEQLALYGAARTLVDWHARHGFCAVCGSPTALQKGGWARKCEGCGAEHFPRVDPVAIMLAEHDGRILLGRQPRFPHKQFSALAGFIEPGESIEEGVARELFEEAGIRVANVRYISSQPWPFPSSLMIGCTSEALDDALTLDTTEIEEAAWFTRQEVAAAMDGDADAPFIAPPPMAIARNLLAWWLEHTD